LLLILFGRRLRQPAQIQERFSVENCGVLLFVSFLFSFLLLIDVSLLYIPLAPLQGAGARGRIPGVVSLVLQRRFACRAVGPKIVNMKKRAVTNDYRFMPLLSSFESYLLPFLPFILDLVEADFGFICVNLYCLFSSYICFSHVETIVR
jgi:hypothetical protein